MADSRSSRVLLTAPQTEQYEGTKSDAIRPHRRLFNCTTSRRALVGTSDSRMRLRAGTPRLQGTRYVESVLGLHRGDDEPMLGIRVGLVYEPRGAA